KARRPAVPTRDIALARLPIIFGARPPGAPTANVAAPAPAKRRHKTTIGCAGRNLSGASTHATPATTLRQTPVATAMKKKSDHTIAQAGIHQTQRPPGEFCVATP